MKILLFVLSAVLLVYIFYTLLDEKNSSAINESETNNSISKDTSIIEKEGNVNIEIINKVKSGDNLSVILKKHQIEEKIILLIDKQVEIDFKFKDLQAGKKYKVILDSDSVLISFHYQATSKVYSIRFTDPLKYTSEETTIKKVKTENILVEKKENKMIDQTSKEIEIKNFLMGKFQLEKHSNFVLIDGKYRNKNKMYLQKETLDAFIKMWEASQKEGINLQIVSGTRNFNSQKSIWERKFKANKEDGISDIENIKKIMLWSSMPSTSRHHWGTDIDINGFEKYFDGKNEKANKEYEWLVNNAPSFGFCQVYTEKRDGKRTTGYNEEKWHWSYMPLSSDYLKKYKELITYKDISGFSASESAEKLNIIKEFVLGIGKDCNK
ncbi:MAG: M15 family metallopeptidase [Flavobacteriales bacterium]